MSFAEKITDALRPAIDLAAELDQEPLVQAALSTTLTPAGKNVVVQIISLLEAREAAAEQHEQDAIADAVQRALNPPADPTEGEQ